MGKKQVILTPVERKELQRFSTSGIHSAKLINRAEIIPALDKASGKRTPTHETIANSIGVSRQTVNNVMTDFLAAENITSFLQRKKRMTPPVPPKVTGEVEAKIIALACGKVPPGYSRWTLRLLAEKCVELQYTDTMSHMTISRLLKKHNLSPT